MKKLFVCALAASMFTACSQDETISQQSPMQISFDGAFVENATRAAEDPSIETGTLTGFDVWGFMNQASGVVFDREEVTKSGTDWLYNNTQYWMPSKTYYFAAIAPAQSKNITVATADGENAKLGLGTISFTNVDGSEDLLYAAVKEAIVTPTEITEQPDPVKFTFNHMLSKVKFSFKNGFTNENTTLEITNIEMTAPKSGSINVAQADWWSTNQWVLGQESFKLDFSNEAILILGAQDKDECAQERLTIPANKEQVYTVTFHVKMYQGDVLAMEGDKTATINGVALEIGKAYNFTAELNASNLTDDVTENPLFPITFTVEEVLDWIPAGEQTFVMPTNINSDLTLVANAETTEKVVLGEGKSIDGAGNTLTATGEAEDYLAGSTLRLIETNGDATIMNLTIDGDNIVYDPEGVHYGIRGIFLTGEGETVIDNVTFKNVTYTLNDDTSVKTLKVINSVMEGWTSFNPQTTATFEGCSFMPGPSTNGFRPIGNTIVKNCSFADGFKIYLNKMTANNNTIKFVNCTYNGNLITADNVGTIITDAGEGVIVW